MSTGEAEEIVVKGEDYLKCTMCDECRDKISDMKGNPQEIIRIEPKKDIFLFKVESVGSMKPENIIRIAFEQMAEKFRSVHSEMEQLNN